MNKKGLAIHMKGYTVTTPVFNRRLFTFILWVFCGLCLLVLLTSCLEMPEAPQTMTATPSQATIARPSSNLKFSQSTPHPVYAVVADALEVRTGPGEAAPNVGYLTRGEIVTVYETAQAKREYCTTWVKIYASLSRWVCFEYLKGQ
jgi:hypothetical protein